MRLLNTSTYAVEEFTQTDVPSYAVLSHRWGTQEVSLQHVQTGTADMRRGYDKILGCCDRAKLDGFDYVWIDTCCIDKTSSAELSEAINSMFTWYRDADICYAYLDDVDSRKYHQGQSSVFGQSQWFTRGWTLQELIAPGEVVFFASNWDEIGSRSELGHLIAAVTGIDRGFFSNRLLSNYSVAQRMSWASQRRTTRVEDQAYCLMGLFGVSMPLLYGEGSTAFIRLQEEIMKKSDGMSLFAWQSEDNSAEGFLAPSVSCFRHSRYITRDDGKVAPMPFFLTNKGIQITLPIIAPDSTYQAPLAFSSRTAAGGGGGVSMTLTPTGSIAVLNCQRSEQGTRIGVHLERDRPDQPYYRTNNGCGLLHVKEEHVSTTETVFIEASKARDHGSLIKGGLLFIFKDSLDVEAGYRMSRKFGDWKASPMNRLSIRLSWGPNRDDRAGLLFSDGNHDGFGVFLHSDGYWELAANIKESQMSEAINRFKRRPLHTLENAPQCTSAQMRADQLPVQIHMTVQRGHHGFMISLRMKEAIVPQTPGERSAAGRSAMEEHSKKRRLNDGHENVNSERGNKKHRRTRSVLLP